MRAAAAGDGDGAWDLLATASRAGVGDRSGFDARLPEIAREWGAWDGARDVSYRVVILVGDEVDGVGVLPPELPRLAVVVLTERSAGGPGPPTAISLPVRGTKDRAEVDPFADPVVALDPDPMRGVRVVDGLGAIAPPVGFGLGRTLAIPARRGDPDRWDRRMSVAKGPIRLILAPAFAIVVVRLLQH